MKREVSFGWCKLLLLGVLAAALIVVTRLPEGPYYESAQLATVTIKTDEGFGSGFTVIRGDKVFVWAAAHVVEYQNTVKVKIFSRSEGRKVGFSEFNARMIARDRKKDVALLWLRAPVNLFVGMKLSDSPWEK